MVLFEDGAFGGRLGHEVREFVNGISALIKEARESSLSPYSKKMASLEAGPHQTPNVPAP